MLLAGGGLWLAWDQRPYEQADWRGAPQTMEQQGHCTRMIYLVNNLVTSGQAEARLHFIRLYADPDFIARCGTHDFPLMSMSDDFRSAVANYTKRVTKHDEGPLREKEKPFRKRWSLEHGWRHVAAFAVTDPTRPDLVLARTQVWLACSHKQLTSTYPVQFLVNRYVFFLAERGRALPQTRLEARRKWCGDTLSWLSLETASSPKTARVLEKDALWFGNVDTKLAPIRDGTFVPASTETKWPIYYSEWLYRLHDYAAGYRAPQAQILLALKLSEQPLIDGRPIKDAHLLAALWAYIAVDHGADPRGDLAPLFAHLNAEEARQVTEIVDCWYENAMSYHFGSGMFLGLEGHGTAIEGDGPWPKIRTACDANIPGTPAFKMQPRTK